MQRLGGCEMRPAERGSPQGGVTRPAHRMAMPSDGIAPSEFRAGAGTSGAPRLGAYRDGLVIQAQLGAGLPGAGPRGAPEGLCASTVILLDNRVRSLASNHGAAVQVWLSRRLLDEVGASMGLADPIEPLRPIHGRVLVDATIHDLVASAVATLDRPDRGALVFRDQIARALAAHLLGLPVESAVVDPVRGGLAPWQLRRAQERIRAELGDAPRLQEIAAECGLSVSHFARAFRQSVGASPHAWLVRQRIARAKTLMRTRGPSLAEIALACGFADQSHFTRVFAREERMSPGRWRRMVEPEAGVERCAGALA